MAAISRTPRDANAHNGDMDEPTHSDELAERITNDPMAAVRFFYDAYDILKRVNKYGDWNSEYYTDASELWDRLGEWMYPDA